MLNLSNRFSRLKRENPQPNPFSK